MMTGLTIPAARFPRLIKPCFLLASLQVLTPQLPNETCPNQTKGKKRQQCRLIKSNKQPDLASKWDFGDKPGEIYKGRVCFRLEFALAINRGVVDGVRSSITFSGLSKQDLCLKT